MTVNTPATRPRFHFNGEDEVPLRANGDTKVGTVQRSFAGPRVQFRLRIAEPRGTAFEILIEQDGRQVYIKSRATTSRSNFTFSDSFVPLP